MRSMRARRGSTSTIEAGGRRLIRVADDGCGMDGEDLVLSVERHATSKLPDEDLFAIATFGFRGEALPSIAAVSRLEIVSRHEEESAAHALSVDAGNLRPSRPAARARGTTVEVQGFVRGRIRRASNF